MAQNGNPSSSTAAAVAELLSDPSPQVTGLSLREGFGGVWGFAGLGVWGFGGSGLGFGGLGFCGFRGLGVWGFRV